MINQKYERANLFFANNSPRLQLIIIYYTKNKGICANLPRNTRKYNTAHLFAQSFRNETETRLLTVTSLRARRKSLRHKTERANNRPACARASGEDPRRPSSAFDFTSCARHAALNAPPKSSPYYRTFLPVKKTIPTLPCSMTFDSLSTSIDRSAFDNSRPGYARSLSSLRARAILSLGTFARWNSGWFDERVLRNGSFSLRRRGCARCLFSWGVGTLAV